jgi:fumarate hydratase subunit beta
MRTINLPASDEVIRELRVGEPVLLNGVMVTGRDTAHKWLMDTFIKKTKEPQGDDLHVYDELKRLLNGSVIYHCGPVVSRVTVGPSGAQGQDGSAVTQQEEYKFVAAGPTTSIREEPYQADVMKHFNIKGVIGKGGMGAKTLKGCQETPGVYLHAIGGAASFIAQSVKKVLDVYKLEFGVPEAFWVIEVENFPAVVTMDSHGNSQHSVVDDSSRKVLDELLVKPY